MASLLGPVLVLGSFLLLGAVGLFIVACLRDKCINYPAALAIALGFVAHPWAVG